MPLEQLGGDVLFADNLQSLIKELGEWMNAMNGRVKRPRYTAGVRAFTKTDVKHIRSAARK